MVQPLGGEDLCGYQSAAGKILLFAAACPWALAFAIFAYGSISLAYRITSDEPGYLGVMVVSLDFVHRYLLLTRDRR